MYSWVKNVFGDRVYYMSLSEHKNGYIVFGFSESIIKKRRGKDNE